jgi:isopentenyl-diphosphate delta-isomerase
MVVLVDENGQPSGHADKLAAHEPPGARHLAFSVFLFEPAGRLLLQQRARSKYHFPGIWANTCCSHPAPGEDLLLSAARRLGEELGIDPAHLEGALRDVGTFEYRAEDPHSGLVEHEVDHVLVGMLRAADPLPTFDPDEVEALRWADPMDVRDAGPAEGFSPWFATALRIATGGGA